MAGAKGVLAARFTAVLAGCVSSGSSSPPPTASASPPQLATTLPGAPAGSGKGFSLPPGATLIKSIDGRELQRRRQNGYSDEEINTLIRNRTVLFFDPHHLTQIEYYAPDGTAHLWYPGNKVSVPSKWYVEGNKTICFVYPSKSYNPVTKTHGGKPECRPVADWDMNATDRSEGDIFSLASGKVPKVMTGSPVFTKLNSVWLDLGRPVPTSAATPVPR